MDEQVLCQMDRRLEERHEYLCAQLSALSESLDLLQVTLFEKFAAHEDYHRSKEHLWGFRRLVERHPFRFTALITAIVIAFLGVSPKLESTFEALMHWIKILLFD